MTRLSPVERYRQALRALADFVDRHPTHLSREVIVSSLQDEFELLFSNDIHPLGPLISKHCYLSIQKCPICGDNVREVSGKFGKFLGCSRYPECKGARGLDGSPTINKELKRFLELAETKKEKSNRFSKLEI